MRTTILLILLNILITTSLHAQTEVQGEVSGTWDVEGSPYVLVDTCIVPEDEELVIEPGVEVIFETDMVLQVDGNLIASGTENDTILFTGDGEDYVGRLNFQNESDNPTLIEYCKFSRMSTAVRTDDRCLIIQHSEFNDNRAHLVFHNDSATVSNCSFKVNGNIMCGYQGYEEPRGEFTFSNNLLNQSDGISSWNAELMNIIDNHGSKVIINNIEYYPYCRIYGTSNLVFSNNDSLGISVDASLGGESESAVIENSIIRGCSLTGVGSEEQPFIFKNNQSLKGMSITSSYAVFTNNTMSSLQVRSNAHVLLKNNVVYGQRISFGGAGELTMINNLIYYSEYHGDYLIADGYQRGSVDLWNNIFVTTVDVTSIIGTNPELTSGGYNCFWGHLEPYGEDQDLHHGDFIADPLLRGGSPFDYRLRADSPCIDAGNPDSDDNPDGTRADIGAHYFDQENGEPPALEKRFDYYTGWSQTFRYAARAVDEEGELAIEFDGLPDWLEVQEEGMRRDYVRDSVVVSGVVPDSTEDFWFNVKVTDEQDRSDSLSVRVMVYPYRVLTGIVRGELDVEQSPFIVADTARVPAGDSLVLPPGTELYFDNREDTLTGRKYAKLIVEGALKAIGDEQDSIHFMAYKLNDYNRCVYFVSDSNSISEFKYCTFNGFVSLTTPGTNITYSHTLSRDDGYNYHYISSVSRPFDFYENIGNAGFTISGSGAIRNNSCGAFIQNADSVLIIDNNFSGLSLSGVNNVLIHNNIFTNENKCIRFSSGYNNLNVTIENNIINGGMEFNDHTEVKLYNNIITNSSTSAIEVGRLSETVEFVNNIFCKFNNLIYVRRANEEHISNLILSNNMFIEFDSLITAYAGQSIGAEISYNDFYNYRYLAGDSVFNSCLIQTNMNGDSCDVNFNIYLDPKIASLDSLDFRLYEDSPLINAGNPDEAFNDPDGSTNDIGLFGGPYGETYEYLIPNSVGNSDVPIPEGFTISALYPNPFNSVTSFEYTLPVAGEVTLRVYDVTGRLVYDEEVGQVQTGAQRMVWRGVDSDGNLMSTGIYFVELEYAGAKLVQRGVLLK